MLLYLINDAKWTSVALGKLQDFDGVESALAILNLWGLKPW